MEDSAAKFFPSMARGYRASVVRMDSVMAVVSIVRIEGDEEDAKRVGRRWRGVASVLVTLMVLAMLLVWIGGEARLVSTSIAMSWARMARETLQTLSSRAG